MSVFLREGAVSAQHAASRRRRWLEFLGWAGASAVDRLMAAGEADAIVDLLVSYGQSLFEDDKPMGHFSHAVAHLQNLKPQWRLKVAWDAVKRWEIENPATTRPPIPPVVVLAVVALALAWHWDDAALAFALLWDGGFRPGELVSYVGLGREDKKRVLLSDIILPEDAFGSYARAAFVRIRFPKTRGRFAHTQAGRIESQTLITWLRHFRKNRESDPDQRLIRLTYAQLRLALVALLDALKLQGSPFTLGSFRPGRATQLYEEFRSVDRVRMLLRHMSIQSTDRYIQEVQAGMVAVPSQAKVFIGKLAGVFEFLVTRHIEQLRQQGGPIIEPLGFAAP